MKLYKTDIDEEVYYYFLKNGDKRWMYRHKYYDLFGRRKEKKKSGFESENAAYRELLEIKAAILDGQLISVEKNQLTISQWFDIWYETNERGWEIKTKLQRKSIIDNHIKPLIGKHKLVTLNKSTYVREFISKLTSLELKESSISLIHDIFKIGINAAIDDEIINRNRFTKITFEKEELDNFLSPKELNSFLMYAGKYCNITTYTAILLLAYSGLRKGELLALKWKHIDLTNNKVTVSHTRDKHGIRSPKTKNSYRTIGIDEIVINQMRLYKKWCIEKNLQYGNAFDKFNDHIFISYKDGEPINDYYFNDAFKLLYEKIKLDGFNLKEITPHGLRHTHATVLISNGVPPQAIAKRLGNTVKMIYEVYSHFFDELEEVSVQAFNDSLSIWG